MENPLSDRLTLTGSVRFPHAGANVGLILHAAPLPQTTSASEPDEESLWHTKTHHEGKTGIYVIFNSPGSGDNITCSHVNVTTKYSEKIWFGQMEWFICVYKKSIWRPALHHHRRQSSPNPLNSIQVDYIIITPEMFPATQARAQTCDVSFVSWMQKSVTLFLACLTYMNQGVIVWATVSHHFKVPHGNLLWSQAAVLR